MRNTASLILLFCSLLCAAAADSSSAAAYRVIVIPVSGDVDPAMAAYIGRALRSYTAEKDVLFILEMDTFGGRVDAALQIVDTLLNVPKGNAVAFITKKAISAGALIALSCGRLAMKHNTTIGDCAPISYTNEGPTMLGEKFQSPLRAKFRALARRNNYPAILAESMVSSNMTVMKIELADSVFYVDSIGLDELSASIKKRIKSKKVIVQPGELLTMDDQESRELGFSFASVENVEEILALLKIQKYTIERINRNWSEKFVGLITFLAPVLLMIGFAALYTEMRTPGFGAPGIIGIICIGLVFAGQYMVGLADYTEILLILIGVVLLGIELFVIPGFGIVGILGILFMAAGMILSLQGFVIPKPDMPWQKILLEKNIIKMLFSLSGSVALIILFFRYVFPKLSRVVAGPYLSATLEEAHASPQASFPVSAGETGIATKTLRPAGSIMIGAHVYDAVADGEYIEKDEPVIVTEVSGNRIVVTRRSNNV